MFNNKKHGTIKRAGLVTDTENKHSSGRRIIMNTIKKFVTYFLILSIIILIPANHSNAANSKYAQKIAKQKYKISRTYHAYFGIQQIESWIFRDEWYSESLGIGGRLLKDNHLQYNNIFISKDNRILKSKGKVKDTKIKGSGTYSVKVTGLNNTLCKNPDAILSMLYVSTDIPYKYSNKVKISNIRLYVDNELVYRMNKAFIPDEYCSESKFIRFDLINIYQKDQGIYLESPTIDTPQKNIEIRFKLKMKK